MVAGCVGGAILLNGNASTEQSKLKHDHNQKALALHPQYFSHRPFGLHR
jgi:hypothetical protein